MIIMENNRGQFIHTKKYSDRQKHQQSIQAPTSSSYNPYGSELFDHCGNIHSVIPT